MREVQGGGDPWDCGDFGDVTSALAATAGFAEAWALALAPLEDVDADAGTLRGTLCDRGARIIEA